MGMDLEGSRSDLKWRPAWQGIRARTGHCQLNGVKAVFCCFQLFRGGSKLLKMRGPLRTETPDRARKSVKLTVPPADPSTGRVPTIKLNRFRVDRLGALRVMKTRARQKGRSS